MNKKKSFITVILLFLLFGINIDVVKGAIEIFGFNDPPQASSACASDYCATDLRSYSGIRISLVNNQNVQVAAPINFWPIKWWDNDVFTANTTNNDLSQVPIGYTNEEYGCNKTGIVEHGNISNNVFIANLFDAAVVDTYATPYRFISSLNETKAYIIFAQFGISSTTDISNYYFKFEPIYIIKEKLKNTCNYFSGTSREILTNWGKYYDMNISLGAGYVYGGSDNSPQVPVKNSFEVVSPMSTDQTNMIHGVWLVIKNYITSVYVKEGKPSFIPNTALGPKSSYYDNLNAYYSSEEAGLGVSYAKVSDLINKTKLTIYKEGGYYGATFTIYEDAKKEETIRHCTLNVSTNRGYMCSVEVDRGKTYYVEESFYNNNYEYAYCNKPGCSQACEFKRTSTGNSFICSNTDRPEIRSNTAAFRVDVGTSDHTINIVNIKTCSAKFEDAKGDGGTVSMFERIKLFNNGYSTYTNLLNMEIRDSKEVCKPAVCRTDNKISCLNGSSEIVNVYNRTATSFSATNMSCFSSSFDVFGKGRYIAYCGLSYVVNDEFSSVSPIIESISHESFGKINFGAVLPGRIVYWLDPKLDQAIAHVEVKNICYAYNMTSAGTHAVAGEVAYVRDNELPNLKETTISTTETVPNITLSFDGGQLLLINETITNPPLNSSNDYKIIMSDGNYTQIEQKYEANFRFAPIYLDPISGKYTKTPPSSLDSYTFLSGYGIVNRFQKSIGTSVESWSVGDNVELPFKIDFINDDADQLCDNCCYYTISDVKLPDFAFRIVSTTTPFPGRDGVGRTVGSNWKAKAISGSKTALITAIDGHLNKKATSAEMLQYDLNGDNRITAIDKAIANSINNFSTGIAESDSSDNYLVSYVMNNRPNSYSTTPIYEITLTPDKIKKIRDYNKTIKYDDISTLKFDVNTGEYSNTYCTKLKADYGLSERAH